MSDVEPLRVVFIITDFELDFARCDQCQFQHRKHSFLSFPKYCAHVLRYVVETLSTLNTFHCSPDKFQGHICWNFLATTPSGTIASTRNLSDWYEFRRDDIEKLKSFLLDKANSSCSCFTNRTTGNARICTPFDWQSLSTCIRDCLMQCRWSDRIAVTPRKPTPGRSSMDHMKNATNHIVILGGLPSQLDIISEFDCQDGTEKLMQRLLLIGEKSGNTNDHNKTVQLAVSMFEKKQVCLSVVTLASIEPLVVTPRRKKYACIIHKAIQKISKGSFTRASLIQTEYPSELVRMADNCGLMTEKYFCNTSKSRGDRHSISVEWMYEGKLTHGLCTIRDCADSLVKRAAQTETTSNLIVISDVEALSEIPNNWMFAAKPFCFGHVTTKPRTNFRNFIGTMQLSPVEAIKPSRNAIISFLPHCGYFSILYLETPSAYSADNVSDRVDLKRWFAAVNRLDQPAYYRKQASNNLPTEWRESLVPSLKSYTYTSPPSRTSSSCYTLYDCSLEEANEEYKKYLKRLLTGSLLPEGNVPDTIQRALSTAGLKLKDFLADEQLWYGPLQFSKLIGDCKEDMDATLRGLSAALHFQFETAVVLGELERTRAPPLGLQDENQPPNYDSFEDSIFEIVNLLRWALGHYPDAAVAANQCLEKRVRAGCRFAEMVYAELRRDLMSPYDRRSMSPPVAKENMEPKLKRRSSLQIQSSSRKSLVDEYKKYAKRYAAASTSSSSLRFVNMRSDEWDAMEDKYFVAETPESHKDPSSPESPVDETAKFTISETPIKAVGSTVRVSAERQALIDRSLQKRSRKIARLRRKLKQVRRQKSLCKAPSHLHACIARELHYTRRLNVLTHASHVKRQLFPELGQWYSSEDSGSSDEVEA